MKFLNALFYIYYCLVMGVMLYMIACLLWLVAHPPKTVCEELGEGPGGAPVYECHGEVEAPPFSVFGR